jgi:hypothetical protein
MPDSRILLPYSDSIHLCLQMRDHSRHHMQERRIDCAA